MDRSQFPLSTHVTSYLGPLDEDPGSIFTSSEECSVSAQEGRSATQVALRYRSFETTKWF